MTMKPVLLLCTFLCLGLIHARGETVDSALKSVFEPTFARLDKNGDGFLSQEEMTEIATSFDKNGDSYYSWQEFLDKAQGSSGEFASFGRSSVMTAHARDSFYKIACVYGFTDRIPVAVKLTDLTPWFANKDGILSKEKFLTYHMETFLEGVKGTLKCPK